MRWNLAAVMAVALSLSTQAFALHSPPVLAVQTLRVRPVQMASPEDPPLTLAEFLAKRDVKDEPTRDSAPQATLPPPLTSNEETRDAAPPVTSPDETRDSAPPALSSYVAQLSSFAEDIVRKDDGARPSQTAEDPPLTLAEFLAMRSDVVNAEPAMRSLPPGKGRSAPDIFFNDVLAWTRRFRTGSAVAAGSASPEEKTNLMQKVKDAGAAGVVSYMFWELAFWGVSVPACILGYHEVTGHWPDFSNKDDVTQLGAEAFAFVNLARFAVPLRIGLALSTTPWVQRNIIDRLPGRADASPQSLKDDLVEEEIADTGIVREVKLMNGELFQFFVKRASGQGSKEEIPSLPPGKGRSAPDIFFTDVLGRTKRSGH